MGRGTKKVENHCSSGSYKVLPELHTGEVSQLTKLRHRPCVAAYTSVVLSCTIIMWLGHLVIIKMVDWYLNM